MTVRDRHPVFPLPEITYPLSINTIGKKLALGEKITVYCGTLDCHHRAEINLYDLTRRLGRDHGCLHWDLAPHFYCSKCRAAGRPDRNLRFMGGCCPYPHSSVGTRCSTMVSAGGRYN